MPETVTKVEPAIITYLCDECGTEVEFTGNVYPVDPPKYQYDCPDCGETYRLEREYPVIVYEGVES